MSHGKSGLFVPDEALTPAGTLSPFAGLPSQLYERVAASPADFSGIGGIDGYFNHFNQWEGPIAEGNLAGWTLSGATGAATVVRTNERDGEIVLTADGTANCDPSLILGLAGPLGSSFRYVLGKRLWCLARLKLSTIASMEVFFGLATFDVSPTVTNTLPADGLFLEKATTATKFDAHARQDGTSTERTAVGSTLVDAAAVTIGLMVNTHGDVLFFQDGVQIASVPAGDANLPDAAADVLSLIIAFRGASQTIALDWLLCMQEN